MDVPSSIRPAAFDDLPAILAVENRVHMAPWTEEHFKAELDKEYSHVLVVTDDETASKSIGYIVFWIMMGESQILTVAVDLPYRGLGYAKMMIGQAVKLALRENAKKITLEVRKSNLPAVQLYQRVGFAITQVRKRFYSNSEDAYQMQLDLDQDVPPLVEF